MSQDRPTEQIRLDIHDGPLQELAAVRADLHVLRAAADRALVEEIERADARIGEVVDDLRAIVGEAPCPRRSLRDLLAATADLYADCVDLELVLELRAEDEAALTDARRNAIDRIVQSALANVVQHSGAERARIEVAASPDGAVLVEVFDDGRGFDVPEAFARARLGGHLGLGGILTRARRLGGVAEVVSAPGGPTTVCVVLPAVAAAAA
jgi:signal transduction histidine kinase